MAEQGFASSSLLQLLDALNRCVDPVHHTALISGALDHAGLGEIPADRSSFRAFVSGSLKSTAEERLGDGVATDLTWTLLRMTSVRAPSSRAPASGRPSARYDTLEYADSQPPSPSSARGDTLEYDEELFAPRLDVLLIDPDESLFEELRIHLEAREYRVARSAELGEDHGLSRDAPPRLVLTNVELKAGLLIADRLRRDLGQEAPRVVVLSETSEPAWVHRIDRILPRAALAPIVKAVVELVGPSHRGS